jgi:arsenate reductase
MYRELKIKDRIDAMSESEAFTLLSTHGKLVKRPFLLASKKGWAGFKESEWKSELSK